MKNDWVIPPEFFDVIRIDQDRRKRRGYPEAILATHKSNAQLAAISRQIKKDNTQTIFTRVNVDQLTLLREYLKDGNWIEEAKLFIYPKKEPKITGGKILVISAGSSDYPIALESAITARYLGRKVELLTDVGIAGISRLFTHLEDIRKADVIITVAGMDGALPGVVAGLVEVPVIAVPTSVGYGASFDGLSALLTMLNSCAPGVAVVNIDNGYGAGHLAAQFTA